MKILKQIFAALLIFTLLCGFPATAVTAPTITVSSVSAMPGDSVTIDIKISNNPGIMAMAFCITYDSDSFQYVKYSKGYLSQYTVKDHPDEGHIIFVNDESSDKANNGKMISVEFKIKDMATPGKHIITLANNNRDKYGSRLHNSFSNSKLEYIVPTVVQGGITVGETCENAGHKYGKWEIITSANCTNTGTQKHTCVRCQFTETREIPITHNFEAEWTVDKAATPTEDGVMTRHCKNCDAVTDRIIFTYQEVEGSENPDNALSDDTSSENDSQSNSSNTTDATTSSIASNPTNNSNKTSINNTVGTKNPQSVVENITDYQENIKPQIDSDASSLTQNTQSETTTENEAPHPATDTDKVDNSTNTPLAKEVRASSVEITIYIIGGIISIVVISLAVLLIVRKHK